MKIHASFRHEVVIDPKDVINKLIEEEIGCRNWVFKENDKYYRHFEESAGQHVIDCKEEITKEKYEYIEALLLVLGTLK